MYKFNDSGQYRPVPTAVPQASAAASIPGEYFGLRAGADMKVQLKEALDYCSDNGYELVLPPLQMDVSGPVVSEGSYHRVRGFPGMTKIKATDTGFNVLTLGPGFPGSDIKPTGIIENVELIGASGKAPSDGSAGLVVDGLKNFVISGVQSGRVQFGFLIKGNAYGLKMVDCRALFGDCRVGLMLPGKVGDVFGSGSDLVFINNWLGGREAAVWMEKDSGGYHFIGGQLAGGHDRTTDDDSLGTVVMGADYATKTQTGGTGNVSFEYIDFEGMKRSFVFRGYGRAALKVSNCSFLATDASNPCMGIIKFTGAESSQIMLDTCNAEGTFSQAAPIQISGQSSALSLHEIAPMLGYNALFGGTKYTSGSSLSAISNLDFGFTAGRVSSEAYVGFGRTRLKRTGANVLQVSYDYGSTYRTVVTTQVAAGAPSGSPEHLGQIYINSTNGDTYVGNKQGQTPASANWFKISP